MKLSLLIILILTGISARCQVSFKTIAPQKPVVEGESFRVQYVLENAESSGTVNMPFLKGFRYISGPDFYPGSAGANRPVRNFVYTLEALKPGVYVIPGATISYSGRILRSNDAQVEVISKNDAQEYKYRDPAYLVSEYYLRPGEDPYKKIRDNLYVNVKVDRKKCYVGEPVLATFTLYSRLESKSDIVKNPGFYGFTVHDMLNLEDRISTVEKINGKSFDAHIIRKVQLYPLSEGDYTIDPMQVKNRVEFSVSAVNKPTEQEIAEGMSTRDDEDPVLPGTEVFTSSSSTETIKIHVDPLPEKNKPSSFSGAVGSFRINASLNKKEYLLNEEGFLDVILSGSGNFTQLVAPVVKWPAGIEQFQTKVNDQLDKMNVPLRGSRTFRYPFVASSAGSFKIAPVPFSYFDKDSNRYRTMQTDSIEINISKKKTDTLISQEKTSTSANKRFLLPLLLLALSGLLLIVFRKKIFNRNKQVIDVPGPEPDSAGISILPGEPGFYSAIYNAVWKVAAAKFELTGSKINKELLELLMRKKGLQEGFIQETGELIRQCEIGMYTGAKPELSEEETLEKANKIISRIKES